MRVIVIAALGVAGLSLVELVAAPAQSGAPTYNEDVGPILLEDFFAQTGTDFAAPIHIAAHRWLYSMAEAVEGEAARYDSDGRIGIAGDYLHSPRVEGAWLSGVTLAEKVLAPA